MKVELVFAVLRTQWSIVPCTGEFVKLCRTLRARKYVEYGRKLTHRVNILTVCEYLCKTDFDHNKFLKIITENMRARARVCVCTYVRPFQRFCYFKLMVPCGYSF